MPKTRAIIPVERIESRILLIQGHKVILDSDLAELYGVTTKRLNEQVKRNHERFPADFMFQLTSKETKSLRSQIATSKEGPGGRRYRPYAFTEHGAIMAASVLNSHRAIEVGVYVVRAFKRLPEADHLNFVSRVKAPTSMLNGRYDFIFPVNSSQEPMFRLLGTSQRYKRRVVYDTGHDIPRSAETRNRSAGWIDILDQ